MRALDVLKLSRWVERNRNSIVSQNTTQRELCERAKNELLFKVSSNSMRDVLQSHGIPTRRRSEASTKLEVAIGERDKYRSWLLRSIDAGAIKEWLLEEMLKDLCDDKQLSTALTAKLSVPA